MKPGDLMRVSAVDSSKEAIIWDDLPGSNNVLGMVPIGDFVMLLEAETNEVWGHRILTCLGVGRIGPARLEKSE